MLFNSPEFIFVFLPAAVVLHFLLARHSIAAACVTTTVTSLIFYLWWRPPFVLLPVLSILINFALASWIMKTDAISARRQMILGIAANLAVLIYFKYAEFLLSIVTGAPAAPPRCRSRYRSRPSCRSRSWSMSTTAARSGGSNSIRCSSRSSRT